MPEQIPYRITMILRGFNEDQEAIQNKFTIEFTNTCGVPTFIEGDRIGWVIFDELEPPSYETCLIPTSIPSMSYHSSPSGHSSKGSKKSSKATKSKSSKSKSSKSKQGKRNLHAARTFQESDMKESLRREQRTNDYQERNNESGSRNLRHRI